MRSLSPVALSVLLCAASGCGPSMSEVGPVLSRDARKEALSALARFGGSAVRVRYDADLGTAAFLEATSAPLDAPDRLGTAAKVFLLRFSVLFGLDPQEELVLDKSEVDALFMRHLRFVQARARIPVWGSALTVHLDARGGLLRVTGRSLPLSPLPKDELVPRLSAEAARQLALGWVQDERPEASLSASAAQLWILPREGGAGLAFRSEVEGQEGALPLRREVFVDALRGVVVAQGDLVRRLTLAEPAQGSGVGVFKDRRPLSITRRGDSFSLEDPRRGRLRTTTLRAAERLPGRTVTSKTADEWAEAAAVDVHAHLSTLWDYFARVHGRYGWAGDGRGPIAVAAAPDPGAIGLFDGRRLVFGAGDGDVLLAPGAALEIVAHEYTHAVVRSLVDLRGEGESGAIEEGIADLFASLIKQQVLPGQAPWTIGERIYRPEGRETPLRDLENPQKGDQVRSLREASPQRGAIKAPIGGAMGASGSEWVRIHGGIVSHAGYQLAIRIGAPRAMAIFYRAIGTYLQKFAGFSDAMDATLCAAKDLHGDDASILRAVREAWIPAAVGGMETIGESALP